MAMTRRARHVARVLVTMIASATMASEAAAQANEKAAMARVRLTTEAGLADGCTRIGAVRDESVQDLRRKIVKLGGNTAVLSFGGMENLAVIFGDVYRCVDPPAGTAPGAAAPGAPSPESAPARLPLPPPPPPPGPPR